MRYFSNNDDVIDSRDIISKLSDLESEKDDLESARDEAIETYADLKDDEDATDEEREEARRKPGKPSRMRQRHLPTGTRTATAASCIRC